MIGEFDLVSRLYFVEPFRNNQSGWLFRLVSINKRDELSNVLVLFPLAHFRQDHDGKLLYQIVEGTENDLFLLQIAVFFQVFHRAANLLVIQEVMARVDEAKRIAEDGAVFIMHTDNSENRDSGQLLRDGLHVFDFQGVEVHHCSASPTFLAGVGDRLLAHGGLRAEHRQVLALEDLTDAAGVHVDVLRGCSIQATLQADIENLDRIA